MPAERSTLALFLVLVLAALAAVACPVPAFAQSATGTIEGTIVDQSGALLPGVTVTISEVDTGAQRVAVTDANGIFSAPLLTVGVYNLTAELAGFQSQKQPEIKLTIGQTVTMRLEKGANAGAEAHPGTAG